MSKTIRLIVGFAFFFFSSRRRHTRWPRDWSSDVCSSDLVEEFLTKPFREQDLLDALRRAIDRDRAARAERHEVAELRRRYDTLTPRERDVMRSEERRVGKEGRCRGAGEAWERKKG